MFDKYIIVPEGFRNTSTDAGPDGYELGIRLPYYLGLGLSMVEEVQPDRLMECLFPLMPSP